MTGFVSSFEGTEKKLELVVDPSLPSLRSYGADYWRAVVRRAGADILSSISNARCDAYLLSESSLFVFDHRVVMMTCGQTTLHDALLAMLVVVPQERVRSLIYERKNEVFPHQQPTSFFEDVQLLHRRLPGRAFQFGSQDEHHLHVFHVDRGLRSEAPRQTLELLMFGIDERLGESFSRSNLPTTEEVRRKTAVDRILPGFDVDDHLFEPTGYSLNALRDDTYYAVHVTPEPASSYASFETNHRFAGDMSRTVDRVLAMFRPRSYDLVLFDREGASCPASPGYRIAVDVGRVLEGGDRVRFTSFRPRQARSEPAIELPLDAPPVEALEA